MKSYVTGSGLTLNPHEWAEYRRTAYNAFFYHDKKWPTWAGTSIWFDGELIHYSDFLKAKKGTL